MCLLWYPAYSWIIENLNESVHLACSCFRCDLWILQFSSCRQRYKVKPLSSPGVGPGRCFSCGTGKAQPFPAEKPVKVIYWQAVWGILSSNGKQPLIWAFFFPDPVLDSECTQAPSAPVHVNSNNGGNYKWLLLFSAQFVHNSNIQMCRLQQQCEGKSPTVQ